MTVRIVCVCGYRHLVSFIKVKYTCPKCDLIYSLLDSAFYPPLSSSTAQADGDDAN